MHTDRAGYRSTIPLLALLLLALMLGCSVAQAQTSSRTAVHPSVAPHAVQSRTAGHWRKVCPSAKPGYAECLSLVQPDFATSAPTPPGLGQPASGTPAWLQQAYDLTSLSKTAGVGDTIGIIVAYSDPQAESDLATYRAHYNLPPCTTTNGCLQIVNEYGGTELPETSWSWATETSIDLDAVSALCPNCHIDLVEATSDALIDLYSSDQEAVNLGVNQISDSWGGQEPQDWSLLSATFPGVTTVAGSGDTGYTAAGQAFYPAAQTGVVAAGGTSFTTSQLPASKNLRGLTEQAWDGGGAGCNLGEAAPSWQTDTSCPGRAYDDISALADPLHGLSVYDSGQYGWQFGGGTSLSSPLIAAYYALVGANSPAWPYQNAAYLNDITTGTDAPGSGCPAISINLCSAGVGYDEPTGVGSISGDVIPGAPGIGGPYDNSTSSIIGANTLPLTTYTTRISPTSVSVAAGVYLNSLPTTAVWQYGSNTNYGQSSSVLSLAATGPLQLDQTTLTGLLPNHLYHARLVARNADGVSDGYDFTFRTRIATEPVESPHTRPQIVRVKADHGLAKPDTDRSSQQSRLITATLSATVRTRGLAGQLTISWQQAGHHGQTHWPLAARQQRQTRRLQLRRLHPGHYQWKITITDSAGKRTRQGQARLSL